MTTDDKLLQISESDGSLLTDKQLCALDSLSSSDDAYIRDMVATRLVVTVNETSKRVLIKLAHDKDELVRTDAYDSLAVFPYVDVLQCLDNATYNEQDEVARSYAILSWADVSLLVHVDLEMQKQKAHCRKAAEVSPRCLLSWCYALYELGEIEIIEEMLHFLNNEDYRIRCTTLSLLDEIVGLDNGSSIKEAVEKMLQTESVAPVLDSAKRFLADTYHDV